MSELTLVRENVSVNPDHCAATRFTVREQRIREGTVVLLVSRKTRQTYALHPTWLPKRAWSFQPQNVIAPPRIRDFRSEYAAQFREGGK